MESDLNQGIDCEECRYLRDERAAIHQYEGKMWRHQAEQLAKEVFCEDHKPKKQAELI